MPPLNLIENIAKNLQKPSAGFYGSLMRTSLCLNKHVEKNAVKVLKIEPHHHVLEVGFGPGHGMKYVLNRGFRAGSGKMFGVDFSCAMCDHVKTRFARDIEAGKLVILNEDVAKTSLPDSYFDKVFHTNSHLYWPDLNSACKELNRVMKSGSDMATVINLFRINRIRRQRPGILKYAINLSQNAYMGALERSGFIGVEMQEIKRPLLPSIHAIICRKP